MQVLARNDLHSAVNSPTMESCGYIIIQVSQKRSFVAGTEDARDFSEESLSPKTFGLVG